MINDDPTFPPDGQSVTFDEAQVAKASASQDRPAQPDIARADTYELVGEKQTQPFSRSPLQRDRTSPALKPVIRVHHLTKQYVMGKGIAIPALQEVSLEVPSGAFVAVMGPSGSGKSTFMNLLGCLDRPTSGDYWLGGRLVSRLSSDELAQVRSQMIGFVFQGFQLLARANALQNVALPMVYAGIPRRERERRALKLLHMVGLGALALHRPMELSGGEQQRVAIARALVNGPLLLLADEPTGNLDSRTGIEIMAILQALNEQGMTIVLVTHDPRIAQYAGRQVGFLDGQVVRDEGVPTPRSARDELLALKNATTAESPV